MRTAQEKVFHAIRCQQSEADFTKQVLALAKLKGWRSFHARPGRTKDGWKTSLSGDGCGFLDLVLVKNRVIWVELKSENGKLRESQRQWLVALKAAHQEVYVWRPSQWTLIETTLE